MTSMKNYDNYSTGEAYNSMTILRDGSGQLVGLKGEMCFANWMAENRISYTHVGSEKGHHDFEIGDGITVDVKTKLRNVPYKSEYEGHVTLAQKDYDCRLYVFANVTGEVATLAGWTGKKEFWDMCEMYGEGEKSDGTFNERADAGKVVYSRMRPMSELLNLIKKLN